MILLELLTLGIINDWYLMVSIPLNFILPETEFILDFYSTR